VFPDVLHEIEGYTGVLDPRNFKVTLQKLKAKGISDETIQKWIEASGELSQRGYRMEIEAALRTKNMAGISLLGIQDFPGQGTALVGMMSALGKPKPYAFADPERYSRYFKPVVPLAAISRFTWKSSQTLSFDALLANYGPGDLAGEMGYSLADLSGNVIASGKLPLMAFPQGDTTKAGTPEIPLGSVAENSRLKLTVSFPGVDGCSLDYDIWVYVEEPTDEGGVHVASALDNVALRVLEDGGSVFLSPPASAAMFPNSEDGEFQTAFWSTWFKNGSIGIVMDPSHPVFDSFPTEFHSDYQWFQMTRGGRSMILEGALDVGGNQLEPIVSTIDGFTTLRKMGILYEAKIGEGKIMVSSMSLEQYKDAYPEAKALRDSILNYMNSSAFEPQAEITLETLQRNVALSQNSEEAQNNVALKSNGGEMFFVVDPPGMHARAEVINDGFINISAGAYSWTDYHAGQYNDAEVGVVFARECLVGEMELHFLEDNFGCMAPAYIEAQYFNGAEWVPVANQSKTTGFAAGKNTITFDKVRTSKIRVIMKHTPNMGLAISECLVFDSARSASITLLKSSGKAMFMVVNNSAEDRIAHLIVAAYDGSGALTELSRAELSVGAGKSVFESVAYPSGYPRVKAFVWDQDNKPICQPDEARIP
jgi:hypothetical protein